MTFFMQILWNLILKLLIPHPEFRSENLYTNLSDLYHAEQPTLKMPQ
jgi:hypothetical protein